MSDEGSDLKILTTATGAMQQTLIVGRLSEAGIHCMQTGNLGVGGFRGGGPRNVLVKAADLKRARAVLKEDEGGFDEDELARLSEEAGRESEVEP
jgi:Putative prokaryotic signal transducing protein